MAPLGAAIRTRASRRSAPSRSGEQQESLRRGGAVARGEAERWLFDNVKIVCGRQAPECSRRKGDRGRDLQRSTESAFARVLSRYGCCALSGTRGAVFLLGARQLGGRTP
jgi:hypothetical protein